MKFFFLILSISVGFLSYLSAGEHYFLNAEESDPLKLGWMNGFPRSVDKLIATPVKLVQFPKTEQIVIVRFSSYPTAKNAYIDPASLPAYQTVAEYLLKR